ncbi:hypothetical protein E2C01_018096 [Portunus trituberculatus]|uniref:Uncharacterized protein n=1 Tax=Portunus trituberculatus TaxID=210409 RepID=A0A5B7DU61_PORTR|nr:hypothetical protein [Portunus trituberculatus]
MAQSSQARQHCITRCFTCSARNRDSTRSPHRKANWGNLPPTRRMKPSPTAAGGSGVLWDRLVG